MVRHAKNSKTSPPRDTHPGGQGIDHPRIREPIKSVHIPARYMRPLGDREFQGCLKSRA
jgi:hypothetical protein